MVDQYLLRQITQEVAEEEELEVAVDLVQVERLLTILAALQ